MSDSTPTTPTPTASETPSASSSSTPPKAAPTPVKIPDATGRLIEAIPLDQLPLAGSATASSSPSSASSSSSSSTKPTYSFPIMTRCPNCILSIDDKRIAQDGAKPSAELVFYVPGSLDVYISQTCVHIYHRRGRIDPRYRGILSRARCSLQPPDPPHLEGRKIDADLTLPVDIVEAIECRLTTGVETEESWADRGYGRRSSLVDIELAIHTSCPVRPDYPSRILHYAYTIDLHHLMPYRDPASSSSSSAAAAFRKSRGVGRSSDESTDDQIDATIDLLREAMGNVSECSLVCIGSDYQSFDFRRIRYSSQLQHPFLDDYIQKKDADADGDDEATPSSSPRPRLPGSLPILAHSAIVRRTSIVSTQASIDYSSRDWLDRSMALVNRQIDHTSVPSDGDDKAQRTAILDATLEYKRYHEHYPGLQYTIVLKTGSYLRVELARPHPIDADHPIVADEQQLLDDWTAELMTRGPMFN